MKSRCMHLNDTALLNAAEKRSEIIESHRTRCANLPVSAGYVQETR